MLVDEVVSEICEKLLNVVNVGSNWSIMREKDIYL